jgi:hypothetical protein
LVETFARPVRMPPAELAPSVPLRLDFAEEAEEEKEEKISTKEIPVGVVEDAPKTFAIPQKTFTRHQPPPPRRRRDSEAKRIRWYAGFLGILLLLVLLLAKPISERVAESSNISAPVEQPNVAESPLTVPAQPANGASEVATPTPAYPGGMHLVSEGDNLWGLSENYYWDPFLWPNIYRVNTDVLSDPDVLEPDELLTIPILHGRSESLTPEDRRNLAEGYFKVFEFYRTAKTHLAPYALWAAVKFDQTILENYGHLITADEMAFLDAHNVGNMAAR